MKWHKFDRDVNIDKEMIDCGLMWYMLDGWDNCRKNYICCLLILSAKMQQNNNGILYFTLQREI